MEAKRKRKNIIALVVVLALASAMALAPVLFKKEEVEPTDAASILSATVERGSVLTTISGGGMLTDPESVSITVPHGVEITEFLVRSGDTVEAGQPIAAVDMLSVQTTMATVQKNLDYLAGEMRKNPGRIGNMNVTAQAPGRVKAVYADADELVSDVMIEHGALAVISLDGMMALSFDTDAAAEPGTAVQVRLPDGKELPGRIVRRQDKRITVTLSDNGPKIGDTAEVFSNGESIGSGELYVHSAWNVTAASGSIARISIKPEQQVYAGSVLFALRDADLSGTFTELSEQHREYERALIELFKIYDEGAITAPCDGCVGNLQKALLMETAQPETGECRVELLSVRPILRFGTPITHDIRYAQVTEIKFGKMTFGIQKDTSAVDTFVNPPKIDLNNLNVVDITSFAGITIEDYNQQTKAWDAITPDDLLVGDVLWLFYNKITGNLENIVRPIQPQPEPYSGGGGGGGAAEPFEQFKLYDTEIARVTPQDTVTVEVTIDELDILSVAVGQRAEITVDALPGRSFEGAVSHIDPNGSNTGGSTRYTVTISVDRDRNMLTGMNATAILTVGETSGVLTVPTAALSHKGSRTIVYTGVDEATRTLLDQREITIGVSDGENVEVIDGLNEGETVWYFYYESAAAPVLYTETDTEYA